ncbi:hypothetical protein AMS68_001161 [Peltaster fructicola]|uniref:Carboxylic ester hydrolase n=1 Tax=Peltaster fructicola TaxID=286661 RepID=A0A6H0XLP3_9PEZI|nr:hypothetical protein AMS68_001161 [Peltaster fructicola]
MLLGRTTLLAALTGTVVAGVPQERRQLLAAPTAIIKNGTVIGSTDTLNGVDSWLGIEYALQPTSTRRLTNPTANTAFGTFTATNSPTACPGYERSMPTPSGLSLEVQTLLNELPLSQATGPSGENCLNLNVQRTHGVNASSKVPVLVFIYGGGFSSGSTSGPTVDGTSFIVKANSLGLPLVYVAMSYRLAALGFLPGKEMQGISNLGLKDQRLALKWVQENIAAFGGDPSRVTIWGESAGSISVFDQLIIDGGDNSYNGGSLFQGAIMNSGSAVPALDISAPYNENIYNQVVANCNCSGASDTLACLRSVSSETIINAQEALPSVFDRSALHLAFFPRPDATDNFYPVSPDTALTAGRYAKVPIIIGDQEDEGTLFSQVQNNITTNDELIEYMATYFPETNRTDVETLVNSYPNDNGSAGSPFRTGILYNLYPQYKRLAAILGDIVFTLSRRVYLARLPSDVKAWSYLNTYLYGTSPLGTFHASDLLENRVVPISLASQNATQIYYISFAYYQDPNAITPAVHWPQWDNTNRNILNFTLLDVELGKDNFRESQYQTLSSLLSRLRA